MLRLINSSKSKYILIQSGKYSYFLPRKMHIFLSFMAKFGVCPWKTCWVVTDSPIMFHSFRQHNRMGLLTAPSPPQQRRAGKQLNKAKHIRIIHFNIILVTSEVKCKKVGTNANQRWKANTNDHKWGDFMRLEKCKYKLPQVQKSWSTEETQKTKGHSLK